MTITTISVPDANTTREVDIYHRSLEERDLLDIMALTGNDTGFDGRQSHDWPIDRNVTGLVLILQNAIIEG